MTVTPTADGAVATNMTDLLLGLAGEAQRWQARLMEARGEMAGMFVPRGRDGFDVVEGSQAVRTALLDRLRTARTAAIWLGSAPQGRSEVGLDLVTATARPAGPRLRVLLDPAGYPARLAELGNGTRTGGAALDVRVAGSGRPADRSRRDTMVIDGTVLAVLPGGEEPEPRTVIVAQPFVADLVLSLFEAAWADSVPLGRAGVLQTVLGSELKRELVRRLAAGDKDEAIARGLGISLRTCRRYIAEILSATGAVSRFQAGFRIARERC